MTRPPFLQRAMDLGADGTDYMSFNALLNGHHDKCGARGHERAACVLPVGHNGDHEGNGNDGFGPKYVRWAAR